MQALSRESSIGSKDVEKFVAGIFETNTHFTFDEFRVKLREAHEWTGLMRTVKHWDFDVFALRKLTKSPLKVVGIAAAREIQMFDRNDFDEERFEAFLVDVGKSYCKNPYHNALHAADVVQTCLHFLTDGGLLVATGISSLAAAGTCPLTPMVIIKICLYSSSHAVVPLPWSLVVSQHDACRPSHCRGSA